MVWAKYEGTGWGLLASTVLVFRFSGDIAQGYATRLRHQEDIWSEEGERFHDRKTQDVLFPASILIVFV